MTGLDAGSDRHDRTAASVEQEPKFAVRISRGLVTHWLDHPLTTWEQANEAKKAILDYLGEVGEIEEVLLSVKL